MDKIKDLAGRKILEIIDSRPGIWPTELQRALEFYDHSFSQPALSYRLKIYTKAKLITKSKQRGGKLVFLKITDKGRKAI